MLLQDFSFVYREVLLKVSKLSKFFFNLWTACSLFFGPVVVPDRWSILEKNALESKQAENKTEVSNLKTLSTADIEHLKHLPLRNKRKIPAKTWNRAWKMKHPSVGNQMCTKCSANNVLGITLSMLNLHFVLVRMLYCYMLVRLYLYHVFRFSHKNGNKLGFMLLTTKFPRFSF